MAAQRRSLMQSHQSWTDDLPLCQLCGVGSALNCVYGPDGKGTPSHSNEDGHFRFSTECCYLYGVFDGFDGSRVADFVCQCLTAELLLGQLNPSHTDADVKRVLTQAFDVVEKSYFETIDDALAEKANLQTQLPEGAFLLAQTQKMSERLKSLEHEISGTNRALLCKTTADGQNQVIQIGRPHTTDNDDELSRLTQLGLDPVGLRQVGLISGQSSTRRIGDYKVKFNYTDIDVLSAAKNKPIIAEPEIHGSQSLEGVTGFLLLMSEGLIKALESAHGPEQVNQEIVAMVAAELALQSTLEAAAQSVVERVRRLHHDTYVSGRHRASHCARHEDMTLLIRIINYPLAEGSLTPTQGGRIYPVSVPYSNHQSTSKTSVTLSLVMPSQGTLTNGSNTASTLKEDTPTARLMTSLIPLTVDTLLSVNELPAPASDPAPLTTSLSDPAPLPPTSQSPTATLQSTNTHTQSSSSSSGDGSLFRQRGSQAAQPDETGRVPPYVDFTQFYRLWGTDHSDGQGLTADLGPQ
ncbi:TGF-beta-activated kinase 1 and MAP3K7-binding protein 1 [Triplophysa tibetana]|uniref:TGF-beta-activated kinase 1 and MAP3K7-binding protein 1 n=1 Tax=Triplophysa tibetana TaxID=1572043 RepID=A0A5A9NV65_9TELE|nr:TGF-beta-activated kinase 1 and MAP3K7-binding protein 1 [Triplophysa tibetana]